MSDDRVPLGAKPSTNLLADRGKQPRHLRSKRLLHLCPETG
jgi:hypothetical protein